MGRRLSARKLSALLASRLCMRTSLRHCQVMSKRGRGGRANDSPEVRLSKSLSSILRHNAAKEGLEMRSDGYVRVDELLKRPKLQGLTIDKLRELVETNDKQRYKLSSEADPAGGPELLWIRANQGHSLEVEHLELTPVADPAELPIVIHGTYKRFWPAIGLRPMKRSHIHCATGMLGAEGVKSGMRASCDLFIHIDVAAAMADGIAFSVSSNGVVLTKGIDGSLPARYFATVVDRTGNVVPPPAA